MNNDNNNINNRDEKPEEIINDPFSVSTSNDVFFEQDLNEEIIDQNINNENRNQEYNSYNQNNNQPGNNNYQNNMETNRGFNNDQEIDDRQQNRQYTQNNRQGTPNNYDKSKVKISVPNSGAVLTLGIISIVSICCCAGFIGPILSVIALALVPKAKSAYMENPDLYTQSSYSNLKAGQTCAIIGLVVSILSIIYFIVLFSNGYTLSEFNEIIDEVWNQSNY